jgi:hypothetical protein
VYFRVLYKNFSCMYFHALKYAIHDTRYTNHEGFMYCSKVSALFRISCTNMAIHLNYSTSQVTNCSLECTRLAGANIFVKNLVDDIDDEKLKSQFTAFGDITSARVMKDTHGRSRGFGFVCYSNPDEANNAIKVMNGISSTVVIASFTTLTTGCRCAIQER